jgi:hypothetical protein
MNSGKVKSAEACCRTGPYRVLVPGLPSGTTLAGMHSPLSFHGEVWTDARGQATVSLPPGAYAPQTELEYALRPIDGESVVHLMAELHDGRFTIATDEPHVKVAWRISRRKEESQ